MKRYQYNRNISKITRMEQKNNSLVDIVSYFADGRKKAPLQNLESTYYNTRYDLFTLRRDNLNMRYATDGIFRTLVQQPILDAMRGNLDIKSETLSAEDLEELQKQIENKNLLEITKNFFTWNRLFGGAGVIIEVEGQKTDEPFNLNSIKQNDKVNYYAIDRWELSNNPKIYSNQIENAKVDGDLYYYNLKLNPNRLILKKGIEAPSLIRPRLQGWGLSVVEPLIAPSNAYQKAMNLIYELIDESKIDVYKLQDLKSTVATGDDKVIIDGLQLTNMLKNYLNAVVLDKEDDFQQRQLNLSGVIDIIKELKLDISAALKMPMTKIWGLSASGFNSGEDDIINYNQMVESETRPEIYHFLHKILKIECKCLFGTVPPDLQISFPPLVVPSLDQQRQEKLDKFKMAIEARNNKLMSSQEIAEYLKVENVLIMREALAGNREEFNDQPITERDYLNV